MKITPAEAKKLQADPHRSWTTVGENTEAGYVYWCEWTGAILSNPESDNIDFEEVAYMRPLAEDTEVGTIRDRAHLAAEACARYMKAQDGGMSEAAIAQMADMIRKTI